MTNATRSMEFEEAETVSAKEAMDEEFINLDNLLKATPVDKDAVAQGVQDLDAEIEHYFEVQTAFKELLIQNGKRAEYQEEQRNKKEVRKKKSALLTKIEKVCKLTSTTATAVSSSTSSATAAEYRVRLPKRNLPKFGGDVRQWRSFWASFQEIDLDARIPDMEKLNYLTEQMIPDSHAWKVVTTFPPDPASYELAKKELAHRYGREKTLIKVYVRDLLSLVVENAKEKKTNFVDLVTSLQSQILSLEQLGVTKDKYGLLLYPIVESCIPVEVLNRYLETPGAKEELDDIMLFLRNEVRRKEESARAQEAFAIPEKKKEKVPKPQEKQIVPTAVNFQNAQEKPKCGFCNGNHGTRECRRALAMSREERKEALQKSGNCFRCLDGKHNARKCRVRMECVSCKRNHHALMCFGDNALPQHRVDHVNARPPQQQQYHQEYYTYEHVPSWTPPPLPPTPTYRQEQSLPLQSGIIAQRPPLPPPPSNATTRVDYGNIIQKPDVLLQTLLVRVYSPSGKTKVVRAMVDTGAQSTYVRESLAEELKLHVLGKEKVVHQTFGAILSKEMEHTVVALAISGVAEPYLQPLRVPASVMRKVADNIIAAPKGPWIEEAAAASIPLTESYEKGDIDVMIGNDVSPYIKVGMRSVLLPSGIVATETRCGWMLEGRIPGTEQRTSTKAMVCVNMTFTDRDVENLWALEAIGICDAAENKTRAELEEAALQHFNKTVTRDTSGRYTVHLPLIEGHPDIPTSKFMVTRRLDSTTRELIKDGHLENYDKIFRDWEQENIIERVRAGPTSSVVHYLGHRAVYKEGSTTPVRPVFNASGKSKSSPSLNECLEKGPNLLEIIPSILSRFRVGKIGIVADIRKAFLQLVIVPEHRDCLRFLWWENINDRKSLVEYRHCRVVFGVSPSPFLLGAAIGNLIEENSEAYPIATRILRTSMYVDNLVASLDDIQNVVGFKTDAVRIFESAQMDLRGWEYGPSPEGKIVPVLGYNWDTGEDTIAIDIAKIGKLDSKIFTRRTVLQLANSLYDPLGLLSPFTIGIKIIFKKICADERKFGWDTPLPEDYQKEVETWRHQLETVGEISIPRCITNGSSSREGWSVHVMSDASRDSYACCIYLRIEGNPVKVQLIQARARVTPMKNLTIPRAELMGCLIAARLYAQVVNDLRLANIPVTFWTDATTVLIWITKLDAVWGVFVNRRVEEIRRLPDVERWRHVSEDPNDLQPLTPSMFLRDLPVAALPEMEVLAETLRGNFRHVQKLLDQLRGRVRREYISLLVHRGNMSTDELSVGDVVLVGSDNRKRLEWPIGIILELYPGIDDVERTARVRTTHGEFTRPLQRLYPLEVQNSNTTDWKPIHRESSAAVPATVPEEDEEDSIPEEVISDEPEPIFYTRRGRRVKAPSRLDL